MPQMVCGVEEQEPCGMTDVQESAEKKVQKRIRKDSKLPRIKLERYPAMGTFYLDRKGLRQFWRPFS
jgi:hypothetical protein